MTIGDVLSMYEINGFIFPCNDGKISYVAKEGLRIEENE